MKDIISGITSLIKLNENNNPWQFLNIFILIILLGLTVAIYKKSIEGQYLWYTIAACIITVIANFIIQKNYKNANRINKEHFTSSFMETVEPVISFDDNNTTKIKSQRAYRLLTHTFKNNSFTHFTALDLAFFRWTEILDDTIPINISKEILESIEELLKSKRCSTFKRVLVVTKEQLRSVDSLEVLKKINQMESNCNEWLKINCEGSSIETRVFIFQELDEIEKIADEKNKNKFKKIINNIRKFHDHAMFLILDNDNLEKGIAIIENDLNQPVNSYAITETCELVTDLENLNKRLSFFKGIFSESKQISDIINSINN